jgi:hypothetical protein
MLADRAAIGAGSVAATEPYDDGECPDLCFRDESLAQISPELRSKMSASEAALFDSLGFAELYCFPPARRIAYLVDREGEIVEAGFYRRRRCLGFYEVIDVSNPIDPNGRLIAELQKRHPRTVVTTSFLDKDSSGLPPSTSQVRLQEMANDACIELPNTPEAYLQGLGRTTRKHLPYYWRRVEKEWGPRCNFRIYRAKELSRQAFGRLVELNRLRSLQRGQRSGWTAEIVEQRWKLFQQSGLLCALFRDHELVAATLSLVHGQEAYLIILAHDPDFDRLNLGNVALWLTINHLIEQHFRCFHLMWGDSFYKRQFGGRPVQYYRAICSSSAILAIAVQASTAFAAVSGRVLRKLFR